MLLSRKKKRRAGGGGDESGDMPLQITSMADIFTIILVFLLKSFSAGIVNLSPSQGLQLPRVTAPSKEQIRDALKMEILAGAILIDQKPIMTLYNYRLPPETLTQDTPVVAEPIVRRLLQERDRIRQPASQSLMVLMADARTPYKTLKTVLASAANAGYVDVQLIVVGVE